MTSFELEAFLPYRLNRIASIVSMRFRAVYGPDYDLTVPEWRVLSTLAQFGELGAKAMGLHSSMHKTKVSRAVRELEMRRWLKRRENIEDRREEHLSLTPLGLKVFSEVLPLVEAFEQSLLEELGEDGSKRLLAALKELEQVLGCT